MGGEELIFIFIFNDGLLLLDVREVGSVDLYAGRYKQRMVDEMSGTQTTRFGFASSFPLCHYHLSSAFLLASSPKSSPNSSSSAWYDREKI
jgi:hypothetical protein